MCRSRHGEELLLVVKDRLEKRVMKVRCHGVRSEGEARRSCGWVVKESREEVS